MRVTDEHYPPYTDTDAPVDLGDNVTPIRSTHGHQPDAERAYLGTLIQNADHAPELLDLVDPDDFYEPRHQLIHEAITHIALTDGVAPDPVTVSARLIDTGDITRTGGAPYLHELLTAANLANVEHYAKIIREQALHRRIGGEITKLVQAQATSTPEQIPALLDRIYEFADTAAARYANPHTRPAAGYTDLSWLLTGQAPENPPPAWIRRADGHATFYNGRVNGIFGDPETAKSWFAHIGVVEALTAGHRAAIIDVDHNGPDLTTGRLMLLGATVEQLANPDLFRYHQPDDGPELTDTITTLAAWKPAYVVLDSIGEMMPMLGIKSVDNDELSGALRNTATRLANTGACVVTIDHLPKNTETRSSGYAIGGTAKKRAIDGAYLHAEAKVVPAPGQVGKIVLRIEKDRPGRLREHVGGKYLGTFTLDSRTEGITTIHIDNESPITDTGVFRPTHLMEQISRFVEDADIDPSGAQLEAAIKGKATAIRAAIECLVNEGYVARIKAGRGHNYHSIAIYREADDARP